METNSRRTRYPWMMQIILTVLGLIGMWWFGWFANNPDSPVVIGIASEKTGWIRMTESPVNWSAAIRIPAVFIAVGAAILVALVPLFVWARRRRSKPMGFFCSRCHKDMAQEEFVTFYDDVLVCANCAGSLEAMGVKGLVNLKAQL